MELDEHLIGLQGILISVQKSTGDFTKIKYKAENEEHITYIIKFIKEYFISKGFLNNNNSSPKFGKELTKITHFLIINTNFKHNNLGQVKEFSHLINTIPTLSVCILANIIIELDLATYCSSIINTLPIELQEQLLQEIVICLRFCDPKKNLNDTFIFLDNIISMVSMAQIDSHMYKLSDIAFEMLRHISGINPEMLQNWSRMKTYELIGHTFLHLLILLCKCSFTVSNLKQIINELIGVCLTVVDAITVDVYCSWCEITYKEESLQTIVAYKSYDVIEHLQKYKPAQDLIQKLASIARKPKTLQEIILEADVTTMIKKIDQEDQDQKHWFTAFMNTNVLQSDENRTCLNKWAHLCTRYDVARILNISTEHRENDVKILVLKCASQLSNEDLAFVSLKYFHECNSINLDIGTVDQELTLLLNKVENDSIDFIKNIYLLLLQNPYLVLNNLFKECVKNSVYTRYLKHVFKNIKDLVEMHYLSKNTFTATFKSQPPMQTNFLNYVELLDTLIEVCYFQNGLLLFEVFQAQLQNLCDLNEHEILLYTLKVINQTSLKYNPNLNIIPLINVLLNIMEKFRNQFFTFSNVHQEIIQDAVNCFLKFSSLFAHKSNFTSNKDMLSKLHFKLNKFYVEMLPNDELLLYIYPTFSVENHAEGVAKLMKLLPTCIKIEWKSIAQTLESHFGYKVTLKVLTDTIVLLCKVTETQKNVNIETVKSGLKFCLQQYGVVIKEVLQPKHKDIESEICLCKSICQMLKDVPAEIRKSESLGLIHLLSNEALHSLKEDKMFIISIIAIKDSTISQILGERMLS